MHILPLLLLLALAACGGGDSGAGPPPPNPLYVSPAGRDTNFGDAEAPLASIRRATQIALDGYEIVVAPGTYAEAVTTDRTGVPAQAVTLLADVTGGRTDSAPGPVLIDVSGIRGAAGISLSNSPDTVIDGFRVTGGADGGIVLKSGSDRVVIRNCEVFDNPGDGIRLQDSADVVVFNNLVTYNGQTGIVIAGQRSGSPDAVVLHNTVALNGLRGLTVGTSAAASPRALLRNNIVFQNGPPGALNIRVITTPRSDLGYDADYNLVFPANYDPVNLRGPSDLAVSPDFVDLTASDFRLNPSSLAIDAGDDSLAPVYRSPLRNRTTTGRGPDGGRIDLGYHF
jgi:parallel beta-helix repeat protein